MIARWTAALDRAFDAMMPMLQMLPDGFTLGHLASACALSYMDFRHPHIAWRNGRSELAEWFEEQAGRPCLAETVPQTWPETTALR